MVINQYWQLLIYQQTAMWKKFNHIARSPARKAARPVSPYTRSPFKMQGEISPNTIHQYDPSKGTSSPFNIKKANTDREPRGLIERGRYQNRVKKGVGLFQQLALQKKGASDRKQNAIPLQNMGQPFNYFEKQASQNRNQQSNTFESLLKNIKKIESGNEKSNGTVKLSFKNMQKSKPLENTVKIGQKFVHPLQSFGTQQCSQLSKRNTHTIDQQLKEETPHKVVQSFANIQIMIRRVSEMGKEQPEAMEQSVRISIENNNESLNMSPFL